MTSVENRRDPDLNRWRSKKNFGASFRSSNEFAARFPDLFLSIDTYKAETARQALAAGADIINDISALRADREMIEVLQTLRRRRHPDAHARDAKDDANRSSL